MATPADLHGGNERPVRVAAGDVTLDGDLVVPEGAVGVILFAHGSGSSRMSPRNRFVAGALHEGRLGTLLLDLLTPEEEEFDARTARLRFDVGLLAGRLAKATDWLASEPQTSRLPVGYFGASTGARRARLRRARPAGRPGDVAAVVSRGGRPDLAGSSLGAVAAPTLLIVGGLDTPVIAMNLAAMEQLRGEKELALVPGASHLFGEPGSLEQVAPTRPRLVRPTPRAGRGAGTKALSR